MTMKQSGLTTSRFRHEPKRNPVTPQDRSRRSTLVLARDKKIGKFQFRQKGIPATTSAVSLNNWRECHIASPELLDYISTKSSKSGQDEKRESIQSRTGLSRLSAWVKRSGQGLVVRLQRQGKRDHGEYTDIHFAGPASPAELDWSPISELPTPHDYALQHWIRSSNDPFNPSTQPHDDSFQPFNPPSELAAKTRKFELAAPEYSHELPTIRHDPVQLSLSTVSSANSPTSALSETTRHSPIVPNALRLPVRSISSDDTYRQTTAPSPASTVRSSLSSATTAVASVQDESHAMAFEQPSHNTRTPVLGNLVVSGSVKYRCPSHPDFEPASPAEVLRLVKRAGNQSNQPPEAKIVQQPQPLFPRIDARDRADIGSVVVHDNIVEPTGKSESLMKSSAPTSHAGIAAFALHNMPFKSKCEIMSAEIHYQQDLHVCRTTAQRQTFTSEVLNVSNPATMKMDGLRAVLQHKLTPFQIERLLSIAGKLQNDPQIAADMKQDRRLLRNAIDTWPEKEERSTSSLPPVSGKSDAEDSTKQPSSPLPLRTTAEIESDTVSNLPSGQDDEQYVQEDQRIPTDLPVSPLNRRERAQQFRNDSLVSQIAQTPTTPSGSMMKTLIEEHGSISHTAANASVFSPQAGTLGTEDLCQSPIAEEDPEQSCIDANAEHAGVKSQSSDHSSHFINHNDIKYLPDYFDHQRPSTPDRPDSSLLSEKMPAQYKNTRFGHPHLERLDTSFDRRQPPSLIVEEATDSQSSTVSLDFRLHTGRAEPTRSGIIKQTAALVVSAFAGIAFRSSLWLQRHAGPEPAVPENHVRVRWKCRCGEHLYDDFVELRPGAASELEAMLNRETPHSYHPHGNGSRGSQSNHSGTPASSHPSNSSATSYTSRSGGFDRYQDSPYKGTPTRTRSRSLRRGYSFPGQSQKYLLTIINEARHTPKLRQIQLHRLAVSTDSDLAKALYEEYQQANKQWYRTFRLRGLTSIEFVQFYCHRNRFADISKCPDVPPNVTSHDYEFTRSDLLPPVGGRYLMHLFKHPEEYDDEVVAFDSIPKKLESLSYGTGWGISLTEGYLPERIWLFVGFNVVLFGVVMAVVWGVLRHDIQGASGVASFFTTLAIIIVGFIQACLG